MNPFSKFVLATVVIALLLAHLHFTTFNIRLILFTVPILVAGIWSLAHKIRFSELNGVHYAVFGYLAAGFISVFHSSNSVYSLAYFGIYMSIVLVAYYAVRRCRSEQECIGLLLMFGRIILVFALASGLLIFSPAGWDMVSDSYRFRGLFNHPVSYGNLLAMFTIIWIVYAFFKKGILRINNIMICLLIFSQILLTQSRSPLIALFIVLLFFLVSMYHLRDRSRAATLIRSAALSVFIPIITVVLFLGQGDLIKHLVRGQYETFWQLTGRILMWQAAWQTWINNWLFGDGFAMAGRILTSSDIYNPVKVENPVFGIGGVTHLHNAWLQAAVQTNILGTICFSLIILIVVKKVYSVFRRTSVCSSPLLAYSIAGILLFSLIIMMVGSAPAAGRDMYVFIFYFTLFAADKYVLPKNKRIQRTGGKSIAVYQ